MARQTHYYPIILIPRLLIEFGKTHPLPKTSPTASTAITTAEIPPEPLFNTSANPPERNSTSSAAPQSSLTLLLAFLGAIAGVIGTKILIGLSPEIFKIMLGLVVVLGLGEVMYYLWSCRRKSTLQTPHPSSVPSVSAKLPVSESSQLNSANSQRAASQPSLKSLRIRYQKELREFLCEAIATPLSSASAAQVGVAEASFHLELSKYFQVKQGVSLPIPGSGKVYTADFAIAHPPTGILIDVEIDEPYVGNSGIPHHCSDDFKDKRRNQFFVEEQKWIVVRFAEEQVVKYPQSCCKIIANIIEIITGDNIADPLKNVAELPKVRQWTTKEARKMASQNYRQTYLTAIGFRGTTPNRNPSNMRKRKRRRRTHQ